MIKIKPSKKAVNRVTIAFSKVGVLVLVLSMITASGAASVARGPAAEGVGSPSTGPAAAAGVNATMEITAVTSEEEIYVAGGSELKKLDPDTGGTLWAQQNQSTVELEVNPNGEVYTADKDMLIAWNPDGSKKWINQSEMIMHEIGALEYRAEGDNITTWDHHDGFVNRAYAWNTTDGTNETLVYTTIKETQQIHAWQQWFWGEVRDGEGANPTNLARWEAPLGEGHTYDKDYGSDTFRGHAMGSVRDYMFTENDENGSNYGSKFWVFDNAGVKIDVINTTENLDQIAGFESELYAVNNGSVIKYDVTSGPPNFTKAWETNIWGDNDRMKIETNAGNSHILVANNYDVALLDENGNVIWNRTFSHPVDDIGISETTQPTYKISGEVFDANNNPIPNATIEVQTQFQTIAGASTNASGYYEITGLDAGTYEIVAWKSGYDDVKKTRDISSDIVLDFLLQKADESTLEGNVDDSVGNPIPNATVEVTLNGQTISSAKTDSNGFYSIPGIPNGTYEVKAHKQGYQSTSLTLTINNYTVQDFILVKGENLVRGYVRDTDGDVIEDVIVAFGQGGTGVTSTTTDKDGYYEVLIDDGNYTVIFSKSGYEEVELNKSIFSNQYLNVTMGNLTLIIEAPRYMKHGAEATYKVWVSNGSDRWEVTGHTNLTLSSSNYSVLGIDRANQKLEATPDTSINKLVIIRANYEYTNQTELYDDHEVTVANATVSQLPILPPWWRFNALMNDDTIFALIIMIWTAVVASRWTTSFGGLGAGAIAGIIFWYAGYLSVGMMLLAAFVALFLGMNVASNIEYSVRQ